MNLIAVPSHRHTLRRLLGLALTMAALIIPLANAAAESKVTRFRITKQVIASGGTRATNGPYVLTGTVGQTVAGHTEPGSPALRQGFHSHLNVVRQLPAKQQEH